MSIFFQKDLHINTFLWMYSALFQIKNDIQIKKNTCNNNNYIFYQESNNKYIKNDIILKNKHVKL